MAVKRKLRLEEYNKLVEQWNKANDPFESMDEPKNLVALVKDLDNAVYLGGLVLLPQTDKENETQVLSYEKYEAQYARYEARLLSKRAGE